MPRSGVNGTYTLPGAQATQQPLTEIPSAVNNAGWADVEQTFNTPQPVAYGGTGAENAADARTNLGVNFYDSTMTLSGAQQEQARSNIGANLLGGLRNLLINSLGTINQRAYVSGTVTSGANRYTLDRWRVVTSGQSLSWTESGGVRTMTAPAGGLEQVIEGSSILGGDYVFNWEGTATATVNGVSRTKGESFTLTAATNATVRFSSGTVSLPQLEQGKSATEFSHRHIQQETALCQWYYESGLHRFRATGVSPLILPVFFKTPKRVSPTTTNDGTASVVTVTTGGFSLSWNTAGLFDEAVSWTADAEL